MKKRRIRSGAFISFYKAWRVTWKRHLLLLSTAGHSGFREKTEVHYKYTSAAPDSHVCYPERLTVSDEMVFPLLHGVHNLLP